MTDKEFEIFFQKEKKRATHLAIKCVMYDRELGRDVAQEAFVVLLNKSRKKVIPPEIRSATLTSIIINLARNMRRKVNHRAKLHVQVVLNDVEGADDEKLSNLVKLLNEAFPKMPEHLAFIVRSLLFTPSEDADKQNMEILEISETTYRRWKEQAKEYITACFIANSVLPFEEIQLPK